LKALIAKCVEICDRFTFFINNEWIFDTKSINKLNVFLTSAKDPKNIDDFDLDISKL